jgi:hypothetical protein
MAVFYCPNCHSTKILGDKTGNPGLSSKGAILNVGGVALGIVMIAVALLIDSTQLLVGLGGAGAVMIVSNVAMPAALVFWRPVQTFRCLMCGFTVRGRSPARPADPNKPGVVMPLDTPGPDAASAAR